VEDPPPPDPIEEVVMLRDSKAFSGFSVDDLESAKVFYAETLGIELTAEPFGLWLKLAGDTPVFVYPKGDAHEPATFTVLNFRVDDIESGVDALVERGVAFEHYDEIDQDDRGITLAGQPGPRIAWFKDPAGNILSVLAG
jgi:catechol 2,3-dioxygenase-like lactoylglutathione lyase family enzyme